MTTEKKRANPAVRQLGGDWVSIEGSGECTKSYEISFARKPLLLMMMLFLTPTLVLGVTENCRNKTYPSTACCSGEISLDPTMTAIEDYAFSGCYRLIGSLVIPNSVVTIGESAFGYCSGLTKSLTIPDSVTTIGNYAFYYCYNLSGSLVIPNSVTTIGNYAFAYCSLFTGSLTLSHSVTTIGNYAFYYCSGFTGSLLIPDTVTTIGYRAFGFCSGFSNSKTYPNSVTSLGGAPFMGNQCDWMSCCDGCTLDEIGLCECDVASACNGVCVDSTDSSSSSHFPPISNAFTPNLPPLSANHQNQKPKTLFRELSLRAVEFFDVDHFRAAIFYQNPRTNNLRNTRTDIASTKTSGRNNPMRSLQSFFYPSSISQSNSMIENETMKQVT